MSDTVLTLAEIAHAIDPHVFERAERVRFAIALLRGGTSTREASGQVRRRFGISQPHAWRVVQMALDLGDPAA